MARWSLFFRVALFSLIAGLLLLGYMAERVNNERYLTHVRAETQRELSETGDRLYAKLYADLQLVRGLNSVINLIPELDQAQFDAAVRPLFEGRTQLRNIAAAPEMVIRLMYPLAGNEKAIGLDYRKTPAQFAAAQLARETRDVVLAGPLKLIQGGTGLIARMPIFVPDGQGGERFWGLVSAVIDSDRLFRDSGLLDPERPVELALRGLDGSGAAGAVFLGRPELFDENPDLHEISLPHGSWLLAATPRQGWPTQADNAWTVRLLYGAVVLLMLVALGGLARAMALADAAQSRAELANERLAIGERRLRMITDNVPALITYIDSQHHITFANAAWSEFYQVRPENMIGTHIRDAMGEGFYEKRRQHVEEALASGRRVEYEAVIATSEPVRHLRVVLIPDLDDHDQVVGLYTLGLDVTAQKASEALLEMQARVDHLTGLPNRRSFEEKIEEAAARAHRSGDALAVLYVDVDHFKQVNDRNGHDAGDTVLQAISQRLRASVRGTDTVARLGGDEFVVLLESLRNEQEASAVAKKILEAMREPIPLAAGSITVSVSIGVALLSGAERTLSTADLLKQADGALYKAKRAGRSGVFVSDFTPVG